jgi:hypothetical protein
MKGIEERKGNGFSDQNSFYMAERGGGGGTPIDIQT